MNYKINETIKIISGPEAGQTGQILGSFLDEKADPFIAIKLKNGQVIEIEPVKIEKIKR